VQLWGIGGIDMALKIIFTTKVTKSMKVIFLSFAFFAANLFVFAPGLSLAVDNIRVATPSMTSPSVLYLLVAQKEGHFKHVTGLWKKRYWKPSSTKPNAPPASKEKF